MKESSRRTSKLGFTYIEMLAVVALVGMCFAPLLQMFAQSLNEVEQYSDLGTAMELGREAMESVKNLRATEEQIEHQGIVWFPGQDEAPLQINNKNWRVKRFALDESDPLEVHVEVYRGEDLRHSLIQLITLIEDL